MTVEKQQGKNQEIQMLRRISIAFILVQHYYPALPAPAWFYEAVHATNLRSGVDLFFVISGFVISKSLLGKSGLGLNLRLTRRDFADFWVKRGFRLLPAAWLWAVVTGVIGLFVTSMDGLQPALAVKGALAGMLGYANLY